MNKKEIYADEYRGIKFELVRWGDVEDFNSPYIDREFNPIWNIYLYIDTNRIPQDKKPKSFLLNLCKNKNLSFKTYNYYKHHILSSIKFHGGITFYDRFNGGLIKVGCDYNHYGDHHSMYSFEHLLLDAHEAIDSFLYMVPNYKRRCRGNGKLYDESEGVIRDGRFYSKEYWGEKHPEWFGGGQGEIKK